MRTYVFGIAAAAWLSAAVFTGCGGSAAPAETAAEAELTGETASAAEPICISAVPASAAEAGGTVVTVGTAAEAAESSGTPEKVSDTAESEPGGIVGTESETKTDPEPGTASEAAEQAGMGETAPEAARAAGAPSYVPAEEIIKLVRHFQPAYRKLGFLYTASEPDAAAVIAAAERYCDENGIAFAEASVAETAELQATVGTLIEDGADALYLGDDDMDAGAMRVITTLTYPKHIPVYCGADAMVAEGAFAAVSRNRASAGQAAAAEQEAADPAKQTAAGSKEAESLSAVSADYRTSVNLQAAKEFGGEFPEDLYQGFTILVKENGIRNAVQ